MKRGARMKFGKMFIAFLLLTGCLLNLFGCAAAGSTETTAAPEFMSAATETTAPIYEPSHTGVPVSVQYIRTDGIAENEQYPGARVILGTEDLQAYYNAFRDQYDLERREDPGSDYTVGFLDACDKYDEAYFAENYLILVVLEEPSGSIRHEVEQVIVDFGGQDTEIYLKRLVPEAGTDDMAQWHLLVELQRRGVTEYSGKVQVYIDGKLSYDGDRIVPPELRCEFTEPPVGTLVTPEQEVDDPFTGYCGNTQTTLYVDGKAYTFMGGHSVTLTDILLNLDYDPMKVCRCLPEYTVDTEFGTGYGIHLSEGYARSEKGQADLTREQIDAIREIINWAVETNCTYPVS